MRTGLGQQLQQSARQYSFTFFSITENQFAVGAAASLDSSHPHPSSSCRHFFDPLKLLPSGMHFQTGKEIQHDLQPLLSAMCSDVYCKGTDCFKVQQVKCLNGQGRVLKTVQISASIVLQSGMGLDSGANRYVQYLD